LLFFGEDEDAIVTESLNRLLSGTFDNFGTFEGGSNDVPLTVEWVFTGV